MWEAVLGAFVALVGVMATANLFVSSHTRARRQLRDELQLLELAPEGLPARRALEQYVSQSVQVYVDTQRQRGSSLPQLRARRNAGRMVTISAGLAAMALGLTLMFSDDTRDGWAFWAEPLAWLAVLCLIGEVMASAWTRRVGGQIALRNLQIDRAHRAAHRGAVTP